MKNQGRGRPPKYRDAKELQARVDGYFEDCRGHIRRDVDGGIVLDSRGQPVVDGARPPTMAGLQLALGFKSRQSL